MLLFVIHANHTHAQTCTNTVRNMTMCPMLNGLSTNASAAEVAYYDEQMKTLIPYIFTQMTMQTPVTNTSLCTASIHAHSCAQAASTHLMFKPCFSQAQPLKPCYNDCKRSEACLPTNTLSICGSDDGLRAANRACIGAADPTPTTPAPTTPAPTTPAPPPPPATSAAHLRHLATRLPVVLLMFVAYSICE
jgi:hypothetical protein